MVPLELPASIADNTPREWALAVPGLEIVEISETHHRLLWQPDSRARWFEVSRQSQVDSVWQDDWTITTRIHVHNDTGLNPDINYRYRVRAVR